MPTDAGGLEVAVPNKPKNRRYDAVKTVVYVEK